MSAVFEGKQGALGEDRSMATPGGPVPHDGAQPGKDAGIGFHHFAAAGALARDARAGGHRRPAGRRLPVRAEVPFFTGLQVAVNHLIAGLP